MSKAQAVKRLERAMRRLDGAIAHLLVVGAADPYAKGWVNGWHEVTLRLSLSVHFWPRFGCNYDSYGVTRNGVTRD